MTAPVWVQRAQRAVQAWPARRRTYTVVGCAALFFAAIVALQVTGPSLSALLVVLCLPVAVAAVQFGMAAGILSAIVATALVGLWALSGAGPGGWLWYVSGAFAYFALGLGLGWWAGRTRTRFEGVSQALDGTLDCVVTASAIRDPSGAVVDGRAVHCNAAAAEFFGRRPQEVIGRRCSALWPGLLGPELFRSVINRPGRRVASEMVDHEVALERPDGPVTVVVDLRATPYDDGLVVAWREVSERHRQERAAAASAAQFRAAFEHAPVGMLLIDADRKIIQANDSFAAMSGRGIAELTGLSLDQLLDPRDIPESRTDFAHLFTGDLEGYHRERRLLTSSGDTRWISVSVARVGTHEGVYAVEHIEDIHERKTYAERLQFLADHDPLTGLFNRRRFVEELNQQLARDSRYGGTSSVMIVDLDNFKYINDSLGHAAGDLILEAIAHALRLRLRDSDVIGRLGGDEFAVLLPGADPGKALAVAATLLGGIRNSEVEHAGQRVRTTGSIGIASSDGGEGKDLLSNADLALYAAKDAGRNTAVVYDPAGPHAERARTRFRWLDRIRSALEHELFTLQAQPIIDLTSRSVTGCELLVRMIDGDRLIPPETFLPIAERHGLANPIDRLVVAQALAIAARQHRPAPFRWEINLSADSLGDADLLELIHRELARTGVRADSLAFEITETAAITNLDLTQKFAARITEAGCQFALDDFGAGYGSFYYLKHLPFTYLKIDGEFIRQLETDTTNQVIVRAIVSAARELGKRTIAEYVEDAATLELLRTYHVDEAQGYFVGRPADPEQLAMFVPRQSTVPLES